MKQTSFAFQERPSIDERFARFHAANPHVFTLFLRFANEARSRGRKTSAKAIIERLRWELVVETDEDFRINDHYTSRYSRLAIETDPTFADFFETRTLKRSREEP